MSRRRIRPLLDAETVAAHLAERGVTEDVDEVAARIVTAVAQQIQQALTIERNRQRLRGIDDKKDAVPATTLLSTAEIERLPLWVREQIDGAVLVGSRRDVVRTPDGRKYHRRNPLNDLSGGEWTFFLNSVINTRYLTSGPEAYAHDVRKVHPSPKPPQLMQAIIEFFTKEGEVVLDHFMGVGGTLLGASLAGRRAIGIDLNPDYIDAYGRAAQDLSLTVQRTVVGDALDVLSDAGALDGLMGGEELALVLIDPPYGDMMARPKTGEAVKQRTGTDPTPYTLSERDLGNMGWEASLAQLTRSVELAMARLRGGGHVVIFMKDLQPSADADNLLHADVVRSVGALEGLTFIGMRIWADQGVNLYPYGYPYAFVANQIHQYILVFRKARPKPAKRQAGKADKAQPARAKAGEGRRGS